MKYSITLNGKSLNFTLINLAGLNTAHIGMAGQQALEAAGRVFYAAVRSDGMQAQPHHTLDELADLDHPYARRHKAIQTWKMRRSVSWPVHKQKGDGYNSTKWRSTRSVAGNPVYEIYFDLNVAPHMRYVTQGTIRMLPRDPLGAVASLPAVRERAMRAIVRELGKVYRTKVGIRFD